MAIDWGEVGKSTAYGAGTGAVAGSVIPGIGTAAGAVGGGVIAGLGSLLSGSGGGGSSVPGMKLNDEAGRFQYGGQDYNPEEGPSGAEKRARRYDELGDYYAKRPDTYADYTQANQDYAQQQEARQRQMALGQQYQDVIDGKTPSRAEMQLRAGQDATAQQALNMAASARGGGALLAQQQAVNANALGQQNVNRDAAMLRASEIEAARAGLGSTWNNVRQGDMSARGQSADQAQAQAGIQLSSEQQRYNQGMGYRQGADGLRQDQRDTALSIWQGNQAARTALATGAQQAAAADRASNRAMIAGLGSGAMAGAVNVYTGGGKKA